MHAISPQKLSHSPTPLRSSNKFRLEATVGSKSAQPSDTVRDAVSASRKLHWKRFEGSLAGTALAKCRVWEDVSRQESKSSGHYLHRAGVLDAGAWRVLPGNLERRFQSLSTVDKGSNEALHRATLSAKTGEQAVLMFGLQREEADWKIAYVTRDSSSDGPLLDSPHPLQSPEAVILAATHHLKQRAFDKAVLFVGPDSPMTLTHMSLQQRSIAFQTLVESRGLYASICGFDQVQLPSEASHQVSSVEFQYRMNNKSGIVEHLKEESYSAGVLRLKEAVAQQRA